MSPFKLSTRHRLQWFIHVGLTASEREVSTPPTHLHTMYSKGHFIYLVYTVSYRSSVVPGIKRALHTATPLSIPSTAGDKL